MKVTSTLLPLTALAALASCGEQAPQKPNVLFIAVDDLRPELASFGREHIISPNIDRLASEGVLFNRSYANVPISGASRASIMTGMYGTPERFISYMSRIDDDAPGIPNIAGAFKNGGYESVSIGKIQHHPDDGLSNWTQTPSRPDYPTDIAVQVDWRNYQSPELAHLKNEDYPTGGPGPAWECADVCDTAYCDGKTAEWAKKKLKELSKGDKPFFLGVGFVKPHLPFTSPKKYWDLYNEDSIKLATNVYRPENAPQWAFHNWDELRAYANIDDDATTIYPDQEVKLRHGYYAAISFVDAQIGKVLDELDELGLRENTIVVLWGDHGISLGEHNQWSKPSAFEETTRAPLIISAPSYLKGVETNSLVSYVDVFPTLCDLAGIEAPEHLQGKSIKPILKDNNAVVNDQIFTRWGSGETIITDRYSYTEYFDNEGKVYANMLYDYQTDPAQNCNIANHKEAAPVVGDLKERLETFVTNRK